MRETKCAKTLLLGLFLIIATRTTESAASVVEQTQQRPALVTNGLANNEDLYYFGVGSNLLRSKIENRGIGGSKIQIQSIEPAVVKNHRVAFNLRGFPPLEPGMGSLEPCFEEPADAAAQSGVGKKYSSKALLHYKANECHGSLVRLSAEDYVKLMRSEGVGTETQSNNGGGGRPSAYEEIVVTALPYDKRNPPVQAIALHARAHARLQRDAAPSPRYMNILRQGAQELGLRECYQQFLMEHPVAQVSQVTRKVAICNLVLTSFLSFRLKLRFVSKIQSWFLWKVYVPPITNRNKLLCVLSEIATTAILLPGALVGFFLLHGLKATNKMNPMIKMMVDSHW